MTLCGGAGLVNLLVNDRAADIKKGMNYDVIQDATALSRLRRACEAAIEELSSAPETDILVDTLVGGQDYRSTITRLMFERLCFSTFMNIKSVIPHTIWAAGAPVYKPEHLIVVGGSSRIPLLQGILSKQSWCKGLKRTINPDEGVVAGLAIQAAILNDDDNSSPGIEGFSFSDVILVSIGIAIRGEDVNNIRTLVTLDTTLPTKKEYEFLLMDWRVNQRRNRPSNDEESDHSSKPVLQSCKQDCLYLYESDENVYRNGTARLLAKIDVSPIFLFDGRSRKGVAITCEVEVGKYQNALCTVREEISGVCVTVSLDRGRIDRDELGRMIADAIQFQQADDAEMKRIKACEDFERQLSNVTVLLEGSMPRYIQESEWNEVLDGLTNIRVWAEENIFATVQDYIEKRRELIFMDQTVRCLQLGAVLRGRVWAIQQRLTLVDPSRAQYAATAESTSFETWRDIHRGFQLANSERADLIKIADRIIAQLGSIKQTESTDNAEPTTTLSAGHKVAITVDRVLSDSVNWTPSANKGTTTTTYTTADHEAAITPAPNTIEKDRPFTRGLRPFHEYFPSYEMFRVRTSSANDKVETTPDRVPFDSINRPETTDNGETATNSTADHEAASTSAPISRKFTLGLVPVQRGPFEERLPFGQTQPAKTDETVKTSSANVEATRTPDQIPPGTPPPVGVTTSYRPVSVSDETDDEEITAPDYITSQQGAPVTASAPHRTVSVSDQTDDEETITPDQIPAVPAATSDRPVHPASSISEEVEAEITTIPNRVPSQQSPGVKPPVSPPISTDTFDHPAVSVAEVGDEEVTITPDRALSPQSPPISTTTFPKVVHSEAAVPNGSEETLEDLFPHSIDLRTIREPFTDTQFDRISSFLRNNVPGKWSEVPRLYTVLRLIGELDLIGKFLDRGITDIWFPFTAETLPPSLRPWTQHIFLNAQRVALSKGLKLEKDPDRKHAVFSQDETLPFRVIGQLGRGAHGSVDKVESRISYKEYARKVFKKRKGLQKGEIKSFINELATLKRVRHSHCVELVGSYTDPRHFAIVMQPVGDHNLLEYYDKCHNDPDKLSLLRSFFGCLANALRYLHRIRIRHRDIKPQNILVKDHQVFLADFGVSYNWENLTRGTTTADSPKTLIYAAPEVVYIESRNDSADIWSLGCVFLEMVTVLKGETVADMRGYFKMRTDSRFFYANSQEIAGWVERLRLTGGARDNPVLGWATAMLSRTPADRPTAATLFEDIVRESDRSGVVFGGPCCHDDDGGGGGHNTTEDEDDGHLWEEDSDG